MLGPEYVFIMLRKSQCCGSGSSNFDLYCCVTSCGFLSIKNDVMVMVKFEKTKKTIIFCWHLKSHLRKEHNPDPMSVVRIRGSGSLQKCHGSTTLENPLPNITCGFWVTSYRAGTWVYSSLKTYGCNNPDYIKCRSTPCFSNIQKKPRFCGE